MKPIDPQVQVPTEPTFNANQIVGVIGLTRIKPQWVTHVATEVHRVLTKMEPTALVIFPDRVGGMAAGFAASANVDTEVVWPTGDRKLYSSDPDDAIDSDPQLATNLLRCLHHHHISMESSREGWQIARHYIADNAHQFLLVHDQRNRGMASVVRCALRGPTVVVRPDGGDTIRWVSHPTD